jgi:hypothetical protein
MQHTPKKGMATEGRMIPARMAWLTWLSACVLFFCPALVQAMGLGELRVQSALGQPLRASVPILGREPDNVLQVCVKARVLTLDGTFMMALQVSVNTDPRAPALLLSSHQALQEPAVTVLLEVICGGNISRNYPILLDPPEGALALPQTRGNAPAVIESGAASAPLPGAFGAAQAASSSEAQSRRKQRAADRKAARAAARAAAADAAATSNTANTTNATNATTPAPARASKDAAASSQQTGLKTSPGLASAKANRNVLKVTAGPAQDLAGNPLSAAPPGNAGNLPDGPNLKLVITRRLASDTSPISKTQEQVFSETLRQEQNSAVLVEVGKAEVRTLQRQIALLEAELKQAKQQQAEGSASQSAASAAASNADVASAGIDVASPVAASAILPGAIPPGAIPPGAIQPESVATPKRTQNWLMGLAALLLMCLLAIAWLLWRLLQLRAKQMSFSASLAVDEAAPAKAAAAPATNPAAPNSSNTSNTNAASAVKAKAAKAAGPEHGKGAASGSVLGSILAKALHPASDAHKTADAAKATASAKSVAKPVSIRVAPASSAALPSIEAQPAPEAARPLEFSPPELYRPERVEQAFEPIEFAFPDELELQSEKQAEALQGLPRTSVDYATETEIPTVEEFTDVMYEAEFWISLNKFDKAIYVLEQYTSFENVSSPLPWLFLFDMYYKTGGQDQYNALQQQFQRMFNGKIPDWADYDEKHHSMGLEQMAGLMARVEAFWMTDEIIPFLDSLLIDDRDGTRQGFELGVYRDILFLSDIAKEVQKTSEYDKISTVFKLAPLE